MLHNKAPTEDSDSSLPDLSLLFQKPVVPISSGDIVLAKFRGLYWPAIVRTVYPKQKKMTICYCDEPSKIFKLPFRNVCSFFDTERRPKIENDIRKAGYFTAFDGLCSHALRYLERKKSGYNDDLMKFFDQTYPFFLVEKLLKQDPDAQVDNLKIPPLYTRNEGKAAIKKTPIVFKVESHCSEVSSTDSTEMSETESTDYEIPKISHQWETNLPTTKYVENIIEHILSGKTDVYLKKILSKTIPSEFYKVYEQAAMYGKRNLSSTSFTGPIEDNNKVSELACYLLSILDNANIVNACNQFTNAISKKPTSKIDKAYFIASVLLPESIICAISEIHNVSLSEAKCLFHESSKSCSRIIKNIVSTPDVHFEETDSKCDTLSLGTVSKRSKRFLKSSNDNIGKRIISVQNICEADNNDEGKESDKIMEASSSKKKVVPPQKSPKKKRKNSKSDCLIKSKAVSETCETSIDTFGSEECNLKYGTVSLGMISNESSKISSSCDNKAKIIPKSVHNVSDTDNNAKEKKSDKNMEQSEAKCKTLFHQKVSKKNSLSSCSIKHNKLTKGLCEIFETSTDRYESDKCTEVCNSKCDTICLGALPKESKRSLKSGSDNTAKKKKSVHIVCDTNNDGKKKELHKIIETSNSKNKTGSPQKIPKKQRKNSKPSCSIKSGECTESDECTEVCNFKYNTRSLGTVCKQSKGSFKSSCDDKEIMKSAHTICDNTDRYKSDEITEASGSKCENVSAEKTSQSSKSNSKSDVIKTKKTFSSVYNICGTTIDGTDNKSCDTTKDNSIKTVGNSSKFSCDIIARCNSSETVNQVGGNKTDNVEKCGTFSSKMVAQKSDSSNLICPVNYNVRIKGLCTICGSNLEGCKKDESREIGDLKCSIVSRGAVSKKSKIDLKSSYSITKKITKCVPNTCETDKNAKGKKSDEIMEASSPKSKTHQVKNFFEKVGYVFQ